VLDEARKEMSARRFTSALNLLKEAQQLDPSAPQLRVLLERLATEHQQEKHRRELEQLNREVQQAIDRDDYDAASAKAEKALQKFPNEPGLRRLKELADTQIALIAEREFIRNQIAVAEQAVDSGQTQKALAIVESALQRAPGNSRLESFRAMLRERLAKDLAEADKAACLLQANEALGLGRYDDAARILEYAQLRFADSSDIDEVLTFVHDLQAKQERQAFIDETARRAQQLLGEQSFDQAVEVLEHAVGDVPSEDLDVLLRQARVQRDIFQRELRAAITKGKTLLDQGAAASATEFLGSRPDSCRNDPEFHDLLETARASAVASTDLDTANAAATQMFTGDRGEPDRSTAQVDAAVATKLFSTTSPARAGDTARRPILEAAAPEPATSWREPTPPRSQKPWLLVAAIAFVLLLSVGASVWWMTRPSYLIVKAPQGTQVSIDGVASATVESPDGVAVKVSPGKHDVQVGGDGYEAWSHPVLVQTGERQVVTADLRHAPPPAPAPPPAATWPVVISSNVDGASAYVDGNFEESFGNTKKLTLHLTEGPHTISLRRQGYEEAAEQKVNVLANEKTKPLAFMLAKSTENAPVATDADLLIKATPGASVRVDSAPKKVDARGIASMKVKPGVHNVQVELSRYEPWSTTVNLQAGDSKTLTADLKPAPPPPSIASSPPPATPLPAKVLFFYASTDVIAVDEEAKLKWSTENANSVSISGIGNVEPVGERKVHPTAETTYRLTATGLGGNAEPQSVTIKVKAEPPPPAKTETPKETAPPVAANSADVDAVKAVLDQYKAAYRDMTPDAFKDFWPSIGDKKLKIIKEEFNTDKALGVAESCQGDPAISGDTASWTCVETKAHTVNGKKQQRPPHTVVFQFKKVNGRWVMDGQNVQ
jgi:hypothetical protein